MTNFTTVLKETFRIKINIFFRLVLINLTALSVIMIFKIFLGMKTSVLTKLTILMISLFFVTGIGWVLGEQEKVWKKNRFQLLPIKDSKLVLANFVTTIISSFIVLLIQIGFEKLILLFLKPKQIISNGTMTSLASTISFDDLIINTNHFIVVVLTNFLIFTFISVLVAAVDLILKTIERDIAFLRNKILRGIGSIIGFIIVIALLGNVMYSLENLSHTVAMAITFIVLPTMIILLMIFDIWVFKNYVETAK